MESMEVILARMDERDKNHDERYSEIKVQLSNINKGVTRNGATLMKHEGRISAAESSLKFNQKISWGAFISATGLTAYFNFLKP